MINDRLLLIKSQLENMLIILEHIKEISENYSINSIGYIDGAIMFSETKLGSIYIVVLEKTFNIYMHREFFSGPHEILSFKDEILNMFRKNNILTKDEKIIQDIIQ